MGFGELYKFVWIKLNLYILYEYVDELGCWFASRRDMLLFHSSKDQGPSSSSNKNTIAKSSVLEVDIMIYLQLFDYFKYLRFLDTHFEFVFFF